MWRMGCLAMLLWIPAPVQGERQGAEPAKITIINPVPLVRLQPTSIEAGPATGNVLDLRFFLGVKYFNQSMYSYARDEFEQIIAQPESVVKTPRQADYLATAYYLRGMIYLYHADGAPRYGLARSDFESSIKWNPNNYTAYLELSRVYADLGFKNEAASLLRELEKNFELETLATGVKADPSGATAPDKPAVTAGAMGKIALNSTVVADVYIAGRHFGSTPLVLELPEGNYTVEYRHGGLTQFVTHAVRPNTTTTAVPVSFEVVVNINAKPWANVWVEGRIDSLGQTPLSQVRVSLGASLLFRHPGFPDKRYKVQSTDRWISMEFAKD